MNAERVNQALSVFLDHDQSSEEYKVAAFAINVAMGGHHREVLAQLVQDGPVWDGDVIGKGALDELTAWGLATRICVKGAEGYTGANCSGLAVHQAAK